MRQVTLGDKTYTLEGFRAFKALRAGDILARITHDVPGILEKMAEYSARAEEWNTVTVGRASAQAQYPHLVVGMTDADWEAENNTVTLVKPPEFEEQIVAVFPEIFKTARDHVLELLALIIAPNSELRRADDQGEQAVMEVLNGYKK